MLGIPYQDVIGKYVFDSKLEFSRYFSYSIGDWANISGVFEILKRDNPEIEFFIPSPLLLKEIAPNYQNWGYGNYDASNYIDLIFQNNPNVSTTNKFDKKPITDHFRAQASVEIPLAEKILLRFGYTPDELNNRDCTPKLYLSQNEIDNVNKITGGVKYGCLLFGSRLNNLQGRWDFDHHLFSIAEQYKDYPVYYYSEFDLNETEWGDLFKNKTNISHLNFREQLSLKYLADFNLGYHAGINDAILGNGKDNTILTPYSNWKETHIRNTRYIFPNGDIKFLDYDIT